MAEKAINPLEERHLALILQCYPFRDKRQRTVLLVSELGVVDAIAPVGLSSRSFKGGSFQPFNLVEVTFHRSKGDLVKVSGARVEYAFAGLRQSWSRLSLASSWMRVLERVLERGLPQERLLGMTIKSLRVLEDLDERRDLLALSVWWMSRLVIALGYRFAWRDQKELGSYGRSCESKSVEAWMEESESWGYSCHSQAERLFKEHCLAVWPEYGHLWMEKEMG